MECPKCHTQISDNQTVCHKCHKVLLLECPNCHNLGENSVCEKCGYIILVKCAKCSKLVPVNKEFCKCGFSTQTSVSMQECESDEFTSLVIKFDSLKKIKKALKSQELYSKFYFKLRNLLFSQISGVDCKLIIYDDVFVVNFNKELSFTTSSNKAVRLAIKILNSFVGLNQNVQTEFMTPLNLSITLVKKTSTQLQELVIYKNNVKPLVLGKKTKKYLKGLQIILDQYVADEVGKDYKIDSLYTFEDNSNTISFYEVLLDSYILPPDENDDNVVILPQKKSHVNVEPKEDVKKDLNSFKIFDINAKCSFINSSTTEIFETLLKNDLYKKAKILSISSNDENVALTSDIISFYKNNDYRVLSVCCTEEMTYKPWGFFTAIFKDFFKLSILNKFIDINKYNKNSGGRFKKLLDLVFFKPTKALTSEDARFAYMEAWAKFLSSLENTVIIIDCFKNLDDTSVQTLELYFDKFKKIVPNFVFITDKESLLHSKIKGLLRTDSYAEISLQKSSIESCLESIKIDATDFIQSFYYQKIKENFNGSFLYFQNAIAYLKETGVIIDFENKLLVKNKKSVILPVALNDLLKARIKNLSKNSNISFILAYASFLGSNIDLDVFNELGINDLEKNVQILETSNLLIRDENFIKFNNYKLLKTVVTSSLKQEAEAFLAKNVIAKLGNGLDDATFAITMGRLQLFKEEYLTLWKNSQFAIKTGDYDSYLKNCLGFLSLVEHIKSNISQEEIEENKKDVYSNILMFLYSYSPTKIYDIENILLLDAIDNLDNEKIVKLSNLMLQGALISSNYKDAKGLLYNILSRMPSPVLINDSGVNTKFLLLSLVNIEIMYNIGEFRQCVEIANDIMDVLSFDIIEQVKPASFSINLFVSHILETFRLVGFAKIFMLDDDIETFFDRIKTVLNVDLPEKDCILAIRDFLRGSIYATGNIEEYGAFSKVVFLILQELSLLKDDYKRFAQNIYQAKLLAIEIHQYEIEVFCDLLIGYAYLAMDVFEKAESIFNNVIEIAKNSSLFNVLHVANLFMAKLNIKRNNVKFALQIVNDSLSELKKHDNQSKILFALFQKFYIEIAKSESKSSLDIELEELKLEELKQNLSVILI